MKTTIDLLTRVGAHMGSTHVQASMRDNVYLQRDGRYLLNPHKTAYMLKIAFAVINKISREKGVVVFYTQNPSFSRLLKAMFPFCPENVLITDRWASGTVTNWDARNKGLKLPSLFVAFHASEARTPLAEFYRRGIPSIAIVDSGDNPFLVTYPIPGNNKGIKPFYLYARIFLAALVKN